MTAQQDAMDRAGETGEVVFGRAPVAVATSDAERAAFEAAMRKRHRAVSRTIGGEYRSLETEVAWFAWQDRSALPIDFKQATDQGGWQPAAYLLTRPSGFSWVLMPFDITPYTRAIFEAEGTTIAPLYAAAPTLLGVADGDAVGGKSGGAQPVAYVNGDELDNMLDDRTAVIQRTRSGWRKTALYLAAPSAAREQEKKS